MGGGRELGDMFPRREKISTAKIAIHTT